MSCPGDTAALGDIAEFIRGITFKPDDVVPSGTSGSVRCMRTKNVQAEIDLSDVWSVDSSFVKRVSQYLRTGDLLVSSANSWNLVGKCCWVPEGATGSTFGGFISALRPNQKKVDPRYLYHWFSSDRIQTTVRSFGRQTTNISNLDFTRCLSIPIPLPSLDRQRRIAQALDSVDALRAKRRKAIALLDDLTQSIFLEMFGADRLGYRRVDFPTAFWFQEGPGIRKWQFTEQGVKLLNVGNIERGGELNLDKTNRYISAEEARGRYSHFLVDAGDLVIASSGISIDDDRMLRTRGSFVDSSLLPLCMNTSTIRFKSIPNVSDLYYLRSWLNSIEFRGQITRLVTGSAQLNFGPSHLKSLKISLPEIATQREFAKIIKKLDSEKLLHHTHLTELDALFASLQYRAFRGELWDDPAA